MTKLEVDHSGRTCGHGQTAVTRVLANVPGATDARTEMLRDT